MSTSSDSETEVARLKLEEEMAEADRQYKVDREAKDQAEADAARAEIKGAMDRRTKEAEARLIALIDARIERALAERDAAAKL